jgi:hypothetical protein
MGGAAAGGSAAAGTGGVGGTGGTGQAGGAMGGDGGGTAPVLVERGLLVRYYVDEAASGAAPVVLLDSAPAPLNLPIIYEGALSFVEQAGNRGLRWNDSGDDGRAMVQVQGTKLESSLQGATAATVESVVAISDNTSHWGRILHIGLGGDFGHFSLHTSNIGASAVFWWKSPDTTFSGGEWPISFGSLGRIVIHLVLDTSLPSGEDRVRLYVDGVRTTAGNPSGYPILQPSQNETINLGNGSWFVLGNIDGGTQSFDGVLFYAATYDVALTDNELAHNTAVLLADDDTPGQPSPTIQLLEATE